MPCSALNLVVDANTKVVNFPGCSPSKTVQRKMPVWYDPQEYALEQKQVRKAADTFSSAAEISYMLSDFLQQKRWRDALLFVTGLNTKLRAVDLGALTWKDILDENMEVKKEWDFTERKTSKVIHITSNEALTKMVDIYMRKAGAPESLDRYCFEAAGNRKNHTHRRRTQCDNYVVACNRIERLIVTNDLDVVSEEYDEFSIHVCLDNSATIDWSFDPVTSKGILVEEMESKEPIGMTNVSINRIIKEEAEKLGIFDNDVRRITSHSMRKAAATAAEGLFPDRKIPEGLYQMMAPRQIVSRFMGHSSIDVTNHYINESDIFRNIFLFINLGIEAIDKFNLEES